MSLMFLVLWLTLAWAAGHLAARKGRSAALFFVIGLLVPIVGLVIAAVLGPRDDVLEQRAIASAAARRCPACAELVRREATVCKHCGTALPELPSLALHDRHISLALLLIAGGVAGVAALDRTDAQSWTILPALCVPIGVTWYVVARVRRWRASRAR